VWVRRTSDGHWLGIVPHRDAGPHGWPYVRQVHGPSTGTASPSRTPAYDVQLTALLNTPVQLNTAMLSQPSPELVMSAGSQPLPGTAVQVGSQ
jgi:hypothetical protein